MSQQPDKVLIIGAGVAGMSAAQHLKKEGFEAIILEGQDRVGGRVAPVLFGEHYIDTGATWIHYFKGNPLTAFAEMTGDEVVEDAYEPFEVWDAVSKQWLGKEKYLALELSEEVRNAATAYFLENDTDISVADFFDNYVSDKDWSSALQGTVKFLYTALYETDYGATIHEIVPTDERSLSKFGNEGEVDGLIIGSFKNWIDDLQKGLDIRFNQTVQSINYQDDKVKVTTQHEVFECDKVIVTVSLGVLKHGSIQFVPQLPIAKQYAIEHFQYGILEKIVCTFDQRFWGESRLFYYMNQANKSLAFPMIMDFTETAGQPTLGIYHAADFSQSIEDLSDEVIMEQVTAMLKELFAAAYRAPLQTYVSRWSTNPFFRGAYSCSSDSNNKYYVESLAEPIGRKVFFAGEATSLEGQAYVHGAYFSGFREAKRVISG